jgi:hypothetical protein
MIFLNFGYLFDTVTTSNKLSINPTVHQSGHTVLDERNANWFKRLPVHKKVDYFIKNGMGIRAIAKELHLPKKTVRAILHSNVLKDVMQS